MSGTNGQQYYILSARGESVFEIYLSAEYPDSAADHFPAGTNVLLPIAKTLQYKDTEEAAPSDAAPASPAPSAPAQAELPKNAKLSIQPAKVLTLVGFDLLLTAQVNVDVPLAGVSWSVSGKNADPNDLTDNGDGTATLRPSRAGTYTVTAKIGKKTAKATVTAGEPVTKVEITGMNTCKRGKTLSLKAKLTPQKAADKTVIWSLDVVEDIATINSKGTLKVSKKAEPGTVITVTCTSMFANEPVTGTLQVTVTE